MYKISMQRCLIGRTISIFPHKLSNDKNTIHITFFWNVMFSLADRFNVYHPEVFYKYMNIKCVSQTHFFNKLFYYLGQHVATLTESSSGPSKTQILT